jgi:hypothetical protein
MFQIGDKVAYSVQFLRSIGESHSDLAHARGTVQNVVSLGDGKALVVVTWNDQTIPGKVLSVNLAHVGLNRKFQNVD